jgi:hypothetical protein
VYGLGGRDPWWWKIEPDSAYTKEWRGHTTERSSLLLNTVGMVEPKDTETDEVQEDPEDQLAEVYKVRLGSWRAWETPLSDRAFD